MDSDSVIFILEIGTVLFLLALGYFAGSYTERRHFQNLVARESTNGDFLITQLRSFPGVVLGPTPPKMFSAEAVIGSDYLKSFLSGIRKIFGGELRSYLSLIQRARREALQRIVEQARQQGYNAICNVRFESVDVAGNALAGQRLPMVCVVASATAYHFARNSHPPPTP